jgi:hypothetical protein
MNSAALLHVRGIVTGFGDRFEGVLRMLWPDFNVLGDLPSGIHRATIAEVIAHFGHGTAQRVAITARLERLYELARRTGHIQRFIIFGSYVTAEPNPRDVDYISRDAGRFSTS